MQRGRASPRMPTGNGVPNLGSWLTTRRISGIAGLSYVAGVAVENQEVLNAPTLFSSVDEIHANYADHAFAVVTSFAGILAQVSFVVFVAAMVVWLRDRDGEADPWPTIALAGGIASTAIAAAGLAGNAPLVAGSDAGVSDDVAGTLFDIRLLTQFVAGGFVALFLGGVGISALRSRALPWPLPQLALAIGAALLLAPIAAFEQTHGLELAAAVAYGANTLWIFLTGTWLVLADGLSPLAFLRRAAFLVLVLAAGLVGIALITAPDGTGQFFAWVLAPEPLAAFAGGVYVGAAAAYALALPRSAREVRGLVLGAIVLSVSVLIVTLAHTDQFDFDRLQAIMWVVLFATFSLVTIALFVLERPAGEARPARLSGWARTLLGAIAVAGAALAVALWVDPSGVSGPSPFELPPLGGGFAGSWVALLAVACGWAAVRDRVDEARASALLLVALPAGALVAALSTIDALNPAGAAAAYIAALTALVLTGVAVLIDSRAG
jgi:hypothetical protein